MLVPGRAEDRVLAAALCARYSDRRGEPKVTVLVDGEELEVEPAKPEDSARLVIE